MKIIAFGIREDEQVAVDVWMTKHPEVQVHMMLLIFYKLEFR